MNPFTWSPEGDNDIELSSLIEKLICWFSLMGIAWMRVYTAVLVRLINVRAYFVRNVEDVLLEDLMYEWQYVPHNPVEVICVGSSIYFNVNAAY